MLSMAADSLEIPDQMQATAEPVTIKPVSVRSHPSVLNPLILAVWFGIVAGLVEGVGLLLFQRINWRQWGESIHVGRAILWISALTDLLLFSSVVLAMMLASRLLPRLHAFRAIAFALVTLTIFDWLLIPRRLYDFTCIFLAAGVGAVVSRWIAKHSAEVMWFCRRSLPALSAALVVLFAGVEGGRWLSEKRTLQELLPVASGSPNVVVVIFDTLRADHISAYGYSRPTTPNIDRLAREGVLFQNAVSPSSWSFPSHVSLLTGKYPFQDGLGKVPPMSVWGGAANLIASPMIGEELQRRGYRTGAFSSNRIYFDQNSGFGRGFMHFEDYFFSPSDMGMRTVLGREISRWLLSPKTTTRVVQALGLGNWLDLDLENSTEKIGAHSFRAFAARKRGQEVNRELLHWIDAEQGRPFFAVVNYFDVHFRYGGPAVRLIRDNWEAERVDLYDKGLAYGDECFGRLMAELAKRNLAANTLVLVTADHGELLGEHEIPFHGRSLYWDLLHVPMIFWWPGHVPAGVRVPNVVSTALIPATLSSEIPGQHHFSFPGDSLAGFWQQPAREPSTSAAFAEMSYNAFEEDLPPGLKEPVPTDRNGAMKSVVAAQWHLLTHTKLGDQLFDWQKDPAEMDNLINTPEGRAAAAVLRGKLLDLLAGGEPMRLAAKSAVPLDLGQTTPATFVRRINQPSRVDDYYLLHATPGHVLSFEVKPANSKPTPGVDSVLAVEDENGNILRACRNPEDDHLPAPGISDPTPEAFDDLCVNNHAVAGVESNSQLEIQVPGHPGSLANLYLRITDWNGSVVAAGASYTVSASEAPQASVGALPLTQRNTGN